jgi:hypothetical protein
MRDTVTSHFILLCVGASVALSCGGDVDEPVADAGLEDAGDGSSVADVDSGEGTGTSDTDVLDGPDTPEVDAADGGDTDGTDDVEVGADTDDSGGTLNGCGGGGPLLWEGAAADPGDACACAGVLVCSSGTLDCVGERPVNACGGCVEFPADRTLGTSCGACSGQVWTCNGPDELVCPGTTQPQNECGGCGSLAGEPLELCDSDDGAGLWVCTSEDSVRCLGAGRNDCGGLEQLSGSVGGPCGVCGDGRLACDGRDALTCRGGAAGQNACGGCAPLAGEPDETCGTCGGVWQCDPEADRVVCSQPSRNACGGCSPLSGGPGDTCPEGVAFCEDASSLGCGPPSLNDCGGRGSLDARPGSTCGACGDGVYVCAGREQVVCVDATPLNACGSCERLSGQPGSVCAFNHTWQCGSDGNVECRLSRLTRVVDDGGGTVQLGDQVSLDADLDSVDGPTGITIELSELTSIPGYELTSPVFRFLPEGLEFQIPITIRMSTRDTDDVDMWWSQRASEGDGYDAQASTLDGSIVEAQVDHFSIGFVGRYIGADACTSDIDGDSCSTGLGGACEAGTLTCRAGEPVCEPTASGCDGGGANVCAEFGVREDDAEFILDEYGGCVSTGDPAGCCGVIGGGASECCITACAASECLSDCGGGREACVACLIRECGVERIIPPESCTGGVDEDEDGDIDCEDLDCSASLNCADTGCGVCPASTECVDDRGCFTAAVSPEDYVTSTRWAYVAGTVLGESIPAGESFTEDQVRRGESAGVCCFDVDGDGTVDNGAGALNETLSALAGDPGELIMGAIMDEDLSVLVEYRRGFSVSGQASLHFFSGTNDIDGDGLADQDYDTRADGRGSFWILPESFGPRGSRAQLNRSTWAALSGRYEGIGESPFFMPASAIVMGLNPGSLFSSLSAGSSGFDLGGAVEVRGLRVEADLEVARPNRSLVFDYGDGLSYGGLRIGGYVLLDDTFRGLAVAIESCTCAVGNTTGEPPSMTFGEGVNPRSPTRYGIICNDTSFDVSECAAENVICENLSLICSTGAQLYSTLSLGDLDTNGNGIDDAMSFGAYLTLVPATIADGTFPPACLDADGDLYGVGVDCRDRDCDDTRATVNPEAFELCDGLDNDCDTVVDDNPRDVGALCGCDGTIVCSGSGTLSCADPGANACGGCSVLSQPPDSPCGNCGTTFCLNSEETACDDPCQ